MTKAELGRRLGVDRGTVHRWETNQTRPDDPNLVSAFAELFGLDVDEALDRAGLKPGTPTLSPSRDGPLDPDVKIVLRRLADPNVSDVEKATIRATLRYLADLADRTPAPQKRARKRAS